MYVGNLRKGDRVEVHVRGRIFPAIFERKLPPTGKDEALIRITPLVNNCSYYHVTAYQIRKKLKKDQ